MDVQAVINESDEKFRAANPIDHRHRVYSEHMIAVRDKFRIVALQSRHDKEIARLRKFEDLWRDRLAAIPLDDDAYESLYPDIDRRAKELLEADNEGSER